MTDHESAAEVAKIITEAAPLPLLDAAYALWRRRYRLDSLEGRPTAEEVEINRAMTSEQFAVKYRWERDHAQDGPAFNHLKRAHRRADDDAIKQAIITAVKFEDACFRHFEQGAGRVLATLLNRPWHARGMIIRAFSKTPTSGLPTTSPILINSAKAQKQSLVTTLPRLSLIA